MTKTYEVQGLTCDGCARTVQKLISSVPGVTAVEVSLSNKTLTLSQPEAVTAKDLQEKLKAFPYRIEEK